MSLWQRLLRIFCLALCALSPARGAPPPAISEKEPGQGQAARVDRYGDPLPAGAVARLGTIRLRHTGLVHEVGWLPGGKSIASVGDDGVRVWDAGTGRPLGSWFPRRRTWDGNGLPTSLTL